MNLLALPEVDAPRSADSEVASKLPASCKPFRRSGRFYMTDKAGDVLFQVHSGVLKHHSAWFRAYLAQPEGALPPGWHEAQDVRDAPEDLSVFVHRERGEVSCSRPSLKDPVADAIVLDDISADELEAFLSVLYPRDFNTFELDATSDCDWIAVLKVAHAWDCPTIKALAVDRLEAILSTSLNVSYFKQLSLAHEYNVDSWVEKALDGLRSRRSPLSEEEITQMRPADVCHVIQAREADLRNAVARATQEAQTLGDKAQEGAASRSSRDADNAVPSPKPVEDGFGNKASETDGKSSVVSASQLDGSESMTACSESSSSEEEPPVKQSETINEPDALSGAEFEDLARVVQRLLEGLTPDNIDSTVNEISEWVVKSADKNAECTLMHISKLIVDKAANLEADAVDLYARMCLTLVRRLRNVHQVVYLGSLEDVGYAFQLSLIKSFKRTFDIVHGRSKCHQSGSEVGARCGLALTRFFGELFKKVIINEGFVRAFIERLLAKVADPQKEDLETICELLRVAGSKLDTVERQTTMDGYIDRMWAMHLKLVADGNRCVGSSTVKNITELRKRHWLPISV